MEKFPRYPSTFGSLTPPILCAATEGGRFLFVKGANSAGLWRYDVREAGGGGWHEINLRYNLEGRLAELFYHTNNMLGLVGGEEVDLRVPLRLSLRLYLRLSLRLEAGLLRHLPSWRRVDGSCHRRPVLLGRGGLWSRVADEAGDR